MPGEPAGENGCASLNSAEISSAMTSTRIGNSRIEPNEHVDEPFRHSRGTG
jgi:hypothetical protein